MAYQGEFAQHNSIKRLSENNRIKEILKKYRLIAPEKIEYSEDDLYTTILGTDVIRKAKGISLPDYVLSIDGSFAEVSVSNESTSAKIAYTSITDVLLQIKKLQELDAVRPADPRAIRSTQTCGATDMVLAGCNVIFEGEIDAQSSFRRGVIDLYREQRAFEDGESLLDTYEALLAYKPLIPAESCPYPDLCQHKTPHTATGRISGTEKCACPMELPCHSTDAMRLYERFNISGDNGTAFGEIVHVTERLWLIHIIRSLEQQNMLHVLENMAIIADGPLAVFGRPGWLSRSISRELSRINEKLKKQTGKDLLVIGIEKTGLFAEHFHRLCTDSDVGRGNIEVPNQTALLLTNEYIRKFIVISKTARQHGDVNYFGRKFFYRTKSGSQITATLPFLKPEHRNMNTALPEQFPRLADALNLFDALGSSRYPNALLPITLAHGEAAIPVRLGKRVLETLSRELMAA